MSEALKQGDVKKLPKKKKEMDLPDSFGNIAAVDYKTRERLTFLA